jgi:hypothetical protein
LRAGLHERLQPRLVSGENITQAHQFVATGNAQLGFLPPCRRSRRTVASPRARRGWCHRSCTT